MLRRHELTDAEWDAIGPMLPGRRGDPGRTAADSRLFVNAVLFVARTGVPWRDLPAGSASGTASGGGATGGAREACGSGWAACSASRTRASCTWTRRRSRPSTRRPGPAAWLTVVPTGAVAALCPACGGATADRHACRDREVRDLPLGGWQIGLVVRLWQFECGHCGRYFTPRHAALAEGAHATERFLGRLAEWATHGDVAAAARFLGVPEKTAERWYYDHLERLRREPGGGGGGGQPVRSLGVDELSVKKGTASSAAC